MRMRRVPGSRWRRTKNEETLLDEVLRRQVSKKNLKRNSRNIRGVFLVHGVTTATIVATRATITGEVMVLVYSFIYAITR